MSSSEDRTSTTTAPEPTPRVQPPLSTEARAAFLELVRKYCVFLPKSEDSVDVHLETASLSDSIIVSLRVLYDDSADLIRSFQTWCTENHRIFEDLTFDLVDYEELGNAINSARSVFRSIAYGRLLIPDERWEDREQRPKIVYYLVVGVETRAMLAQIRANQIAYRMVEAPHSII